MAVASAFEATKPNDSDFDVLPCVPSDWLDDAFRRHVPEDLDLVVRESIVPVSWIPPLVLYAVASKAALHRAHGMGLKVVARLMPSDYRAAVKRHQGRIILGKALFGLARRQP
jgi:hypothetical protein